MKHAKLISALLIVSLIGSFVQARPTSCNANTPNNAVCVEFTAPANHIDGMPIVLPITYRVEQRTGSGAWAAAQTVSVTRAYITGLSPGTYSFRVFAIVQDKVSEASNEATRTVELAPPNPPIITIAVVIRANTAPVYRILSGDRKGADICGFIELEKPCYGEVVFNTRGFDFYRVDWDAVQPFGAGCGPSAVAAPCG